MGIFMRLRISRSVEVVDTMIPRQSVGYLGTNDKYDDTPYK